MSDYFGYPIRHQATQPLGCCVDCFGYVVFGGGVIQQSDPGTTTPPSGSGPGLGSGNPGGFGTSTGTTLGTSSASSTSTPTTTGTTTTASTTNGGGPVIVPGGDPTYNQVVID